MLTKEDKTKLRGNLFKHLDGVVIAAIANQFFEKNIGEEILDKGKVNLSELASKIEANEGYFNVATRNLASQGWLDYKVVGDDVFIEANDLSAFAFANFGLYSGVVDLMDYTDKFSRRNFDALAFQKLKKQFDNFRILYGIEYSSNPKEKQIQEQILKHIEGILVGPIVVLLGMGGMFHKYFMEASFSADEYHEHPESFEEILSFLHHLGWFNKTGINYSFTDIGLFYAKRASAYGVTISYIPMFRQMKDLLFGNANVLWENSEGSDEIHVDREMNVWGSGGAHSAYFKQIDEIVISIFNRPIDEQPNGILDMGCGNGAFLIHLFEVIEKQTLRGKHLDDHPLFLVGADYNKAALKVTRANLIQADIWAKVIWGDISDPDLLQKDLKDNYNMDLKDLLSVRTFLDHNRIWSEPSGKLNAPSKSDGAFAYRGRRLSNSEVERNLKDHFQKWKPYVSKFGLILIELHTISPSITAKNLGKTAATAYDATHGFSDQYILDIAAFLKVIEEIDLKSDEKYFAKYPNSDLATVSIHSIVGI